MRRIIYFFLVFISLKSFSQETDSLLLKIKKEIANSKNDSIKIVNYLWLNKYYHARDLKKADSLLTEILTMLDTVKFDTRKHRGQIFERRGIISRIRSDYPESLKNYNKAKSLYEEIKDTNKIINVNINIGNLYDYQYDYSEGAKYFKKAIEINKKPFKKQLGISYRLLSGNFDFREMKDSAFYYLKKARIIFKDIGADFEYFASNITFVRFSLEDFDPKFYSKNLDGKSILDVSAQKYSLNDLVKMARKTTNYFKKEEHKHYLSECYYDLTKLYFMLNRFSLAKTYADSTIQVAHRVEKKHLESMTYKLRAQINEKSGKLYKALDDFKVYDKMQNEIYTENKTREVLELEFANKKTKDSILFVKQKEIFVLEKDKALAQNKFILLLSLVGVFIAFFVIRNIRLKWLKERREGKRFKQQLKQSDNEIFALNTDKQKLTEEVNELLTETLTHLRTKEKLADNLNKLSQEKEGVTLTSIIADLKADKLEDSKILVLRRNIETLNYEFLKKIKELHPNLTKTDIEVCSFIKIGFSRSEIARLRQTSIEAIKSTRYRLKKKLNLTANDSLDEYIRTL
ncbi:hypothetical protein [Tenacibaculum xiamenense]|uniref:hypothetical protein n=1 Tax=Tenacibaculum xiamenense TaxID=1261553 RepID=UPI003895830D